jgi:hypothetical protein
MEARGLESLDPMGAGGRVVRESYLIQRDRTGEPNPRNEFLAVVGWGNRDVTMGKKKLPTVRT